MTDNSNRGKAEGINAMMPLVAILAVFGGFMSFDLAKSESWTTIFAIIGIVVIIIGILGFFIIESNEKKSDENSSYFKNIFYGFRPSVIKENIPLYLYLIAFAIFGISIQIFMPYLIIYYEKTLALEGYVLIMAPAIILASIFTVFWGRAYDKLGFNKAVIPSLLILSLGYVFLFAFTNTVCVFIGSLLMMCGYLSGAAVFGAMIRDKTPEGKAGMFQGLRIIGQVLIPGVIGPMISKEILRNADTILNSDGTTSFLPSKWIFMGALVGIAVLAIYLVPVISKNKKG
jgi:MFS family permease